MTTLTNAVQKPGVSYILNNTKYPDYIRNHQVFTKLNKINKVFAGIGLPNMTEECDYSGILEARADAVSLLYYNIRDAIYRAYGNVGQQQELKTLCLVISETIGNNYPSMIQAEEGKVALKFPHDCGVEDGKPFARKGEGVFKVYNKLLEKCKAAGHNMPALDTMQYFKTFSTSNVPSRKYQLVFSSDGPDGAWDIATISMRGISSCQSWGSTQSRGLIGSISSRYVGVVYITSGEKVGDYGSKMLRRSMVRFCINKNTRKPALLVDKVYPGDDAASRSIFQEFLSKHTKIPVLFPGDTDWSQYVLPTDTFWADAPFQVNEYTYMDNKIPFKNPISPVKDVTSYHNRIATLDSELFIKIHTSVIKKLDEYCANKKIHRDLFKGGVANLIVSMRKYIGAHQGMLGHFMPHIYNLTTGAGSPMFPKPHQFDTVKAYERAIIRAALVNVKSLRTTTKKSLNACGKWIKFYPNSSEKLVQLLFDEYKRELVNAYKRLLSA